MKHLLWTALCVTAILSQFLIGGCGDDSRSSTYTGVLEGKSIQVPALTGGKIVSLLVDTGEEVAAGARLVVVDTTELVLQRRQFSASLEDLRVQREIAETNLKRSKADMEYVRQREERTKMLFENQAMPRQNLDDLRNEMQRAQSAFEGAQQQVRSIEAREKQFEAQVETVDKRISDAVITAPIEGLVSTLYYEVGEAVPSMQPVLELIHVSELDVKIYIPEEALPDVKHGQTVKIRVDGVKEDLAGRVSWVSPKAEFTPKTILTPETRASLVYAVKVTVPNPRRVLKHGMPVEVTL
ncbi:MAG: efflux RND transporter periplasmic adaptor subunit [Candidatus Eisenbacteria bacterium]|nr:efflux RND transporter periplasmic adaptor subunit [Candidatus Eisenbacteria bacterium]